MTFWDSSAVLPLPAAEPSSAACAALLTAGPVVWTSGLWFAGRLQTDADRERVVDVLSSSQGADAAAPTQVADVIKKLAPRWFVARNVHRAPSTVLLQSRSTLCWLGGPMTRADLRRQHDGGYVEAAERGADAASTNFRSPSDFWLTRS